MSLNLESAGSGTLDAIRRDVSADWSLRTVAGLLLRARQHRSAGRIDLCEKCEHLAGCYCDALPLHLRWWLGGLMCIFTLGESVERWADERAARDTTVPEPTPTAVDPVPTPPEECVAELERLLEADTLALDGLRAAMAHLGPCVQVTGRIVVATSWDAFDEGGWCRYDWLPSMAECEPLTGCCDGPPVSGFGYHVDCHSSDQPALWYEPPGEWDL